MWHMNKQFVIGFISGLLLFIAINLFAAHLASDCGLATFSPASACADGIARVGWPLQFYESGGFMYRHTFNLPYLQFDLLFGIGIGLLLGWIFSRRKKTLPK
jgi:ABC-type antimicrobial peptide transport system permease subunit